MVIKKEAKGDISVDTLHDLFEQNQTIYERKFISFMDCEELGKDIVIHHLDDVDYEFLKEGNFTGEELLDIQYKKMTPEKFGSYRLYQATSEMLPEYVSNDEVKGNRYSTDCDVYSFVYHYHFFYLATLDVYVVVKETWSPY